MTMRVRLSIIASVAVLTGACTRSTPDASDSALGPPPLIRVSAERTDLLFRYSADGGLAAVTSLSEVPDTARGRVQVIDLSLSPKARASSRFAQIFDLRDPNPGGAFPGRIVPRAELEARLAAQAAAAPAQQPVTMYSASWCGVCRKARAFLTKNGIAFVEKDIEKDKGAAAELQRKAKAAGAKMGGVPVFDVGGRLVNGFDPKRLLELIRS